MGTPARILFVDDEPQILEGFRFALRRYAREWDIHTAEGGPEALIEIETGPFDIVVSDMRMPGMDGSAVLRHVKDKQPDAVRFMLSADASPEALLRTLTVAHQYLPKPFGMSELRTFLERVRQLRGVIADPGIRRLATELHALPGLPTLHDDLDRVLAEPAASCADVTRVVERDVAMSLKVLQLGSSTFFGDGEGEVTRISEAVARLGLPLLRTLWKTEGVFEKLTRAADGFDASALQARSRLVAALSAQILGEGIEARVAFLAARLRDVGPLALATREPVRFAEALATARTERRPLYRVEQDIFGTDHAAVAGYLLGIWGLPAPLVDAVTHHLQPERLQPTRLDPLGALHIAEALIAEALMEVSPEPISPALFTLGGVEEHLPDWRVRARGIVANASR